MALQYCGNCRNEIEEKGFDTVQAKAEDGKEFFFIEHCRYSYSQAPPVRGIINVSNQTAVLAVKAAEQMLAEFFYLYRHFKVAG